MRKLFVLITGIAIGLILTANGNAATEQVIKTAYLTGYSYWDNTPPGAATIAYPKKDGNPTVHNLADGKGTYANPVTLAVGWHTTLGTKWPVGERFYIPYLHKYAMVEDQCGDHAQNGPCWQLTQADAGATTWIDIWVDGRAWPKSVSDKCMSRISRIHTVVFHPKATYPVYASTVNTSCRLNKLYSETVPKG